MFPTSGVVVPSLTAVRVAGDRNGEAARRVCVPGVRHIPGGAGRVAGRLRRRQRRAGRQRTRHGRQRRASTGADGRPTRRDPPALRRHDGRAASRRKSLQRRRAHARRRHQRERVGRPRRATAVRARVPAQRAHQLPRVHRSTQHAVKAAATPAGGHGSGVDGSDVIGGRNGARQGGVALSRRWRRRLLLRRVRLRSRQHRRPELHAGGAPRAARHLAAAAGVGRRTTEPHEFSRTRPNVLERWPTD